jgi:hypothetical protein
MHIHTITTLANALNLRPRSVRRLLQQGRIAATRIGRYWAILDWHAALAAGQARNRRRGPAPGSPEALRSSSAGCAASRVVRAERVAKRAARAAKRAAAKAAPPPDPGFLDFSMYKPQYSPPE